MIRINAPLGLLPLCMDSVWTKLCMNFIIMGCAVTRTTFAPVSSVLIKGFMSLSQQTIIRRTWRKVSVDVLNQGEKVIERIFALQPETKLQFVKSDHEEDQLRQNANIKAHGHRLMQAIGATVTHLDDLEASMGPLLIELGKRHTNFESFDPNFFDVFGDAVVEIWNEQLGYIFKPEVEDAWRQVLDFMVSKMKEGFYLGCSYRATRGSRASFFISSLSSQFSV